MPVIAATSSRPCSAGRDEPAARIPTSATRRCASRHARASSRIRGLRAQASRSSYRVEDELRARGANYIQAGLFKAFAVRDLNLITGQQQYSGQKVARLVIEALGD
jgi:putative intracellular protease/amidase